MQGCSTRAKTWAIVCTLSLLALPSLPTTLAKDTQHTASNSYNKLWRETLEQATAGHFDSAAKTIKLIPAEGPITKKVSAWLTEYQKKQATRLEFDNKEIELYSRYAKERIEREEYKTAMDWVLLAADCAQDKQAFLKKDWIDALVKSSLDAAEKARKDAAWQDAWGLYARLGDMFEKEPRYKKLEHEALTHLRLESMFKDEKSIEAWQERVEKIKWDDAEAALEYIELYYVEQADFKAITESGLEQLLYLAESESAIKNFDGLGNEDDRKDFVQRLQARLDQVRTAPTLSRREAVRIFRRVVYNINPQTVRLPRELIVSEIMRGALEPLDDYTTMIWPQATSQFDKHTRGDFVGVGISIVENRTTEEIEVVSPLEDTPAYHAGIQSGDIISHVDGRPIKGLTINKVIDIITGPQGTDVTLTVRRDDKDIIFPLKRARVKIQSVKGITRDENEQWNYWLDRDQGIGYVRITNFQRNTVEDVANVLSQLEAGGMKGAVLDLRGNPGGLLDSAWKLSSLFLKSGDGVVSTKGRDPAENQRLNAPGNGPWADLPIDVLTDENSASASEILAGAIQDNGHGLTIGARTFGKFSVQNLIQLSHTNAKLKLTTARYYLPSGRSLHREVTSDTWGVEPNLPVKLVYHERVNMYKLRRKADLLGPQKEVKEDDETDSDKQDVDAKSDDKKADVEADTKDAKKDDGDTDEKVADADKDDKPKLPPLEQPNENTRPDSDPQLDTALLHMRIKLLSMSNPTVAFADQAQSPSVKKQAIDR